MTEESGGIPWGAPEAICAIMLGDERMADEFRNIITGYINSDESGPEIFLDHDPLRKGVYWGIERLEIAYPGHLLDYKDLFLECLAFETDVNCIAHLIRISNVLNIDKAISLIEKFKEDARPVLIFEDKIIKTYRLCDIANTYLNSI